MPGVDILATAFNGANAAFIADLYARWIRDPAAVDPSFANLFEALNDEARSVLTDASGASWAPRHWAIEADGLSSPVAAPAPCGEESARTGRHSGGRKRRAGHADDARSGWRPCS